MYIALSNIMVNAVCMYLLGAISAGPHPGQGTPGRGTSRDMHLGHLHGISFSFVAFSWLVAITLFRWLTWPLELAALYSDWDNDDVSGNFFSPSFKRVPICKAGSEVKLDLRCD